MRVSQRSVVTAVILTKNEESSLGGCLESLSSLDDVHVLDSGSTDGTVELALSMGASATTHVPDGRFLITEQRNWALDNLPLRKWVLFIDADERATPQFLDEVFSLVSDSKQFDAIYAAPAFIFRDTWIKRTSGYPNWHPRIVRTHSGVRFAGGVWEDFDVKDRVGYLTVPYLHYPADKGLERWVEKHVRYAKFEALEIEKARVGIDAQSRTRIARQIYYRAGSLRKYFRLLHMLVVRFGLIDGRAAWSYARRMLIYELLIEEARLDLADQRKETHERPAGISG